MQMIPGIVLLALGVASAMLLVFLFFIPPLMIWLNLRKLRIATHADLAAIREGIDRLAGGAPAAGPAAAAEPSAPARPEEAPAAATIGFSCPECGKFFEGPSTLSGTTFTCPECRIDFHIH